MVKSPFSLIITHLIKPQVANQQQQQKNWRWQNSNPGPPEYQSNALPLELS